MTDGQPADGAVDVPTDVQPWVRGVRVVGRGTPEVVLEDEEGARVSAEVHALRSARGRAQCEPFDLEIVPEEALAPHTRYVLRILGIARSFATGSGPLDDPAPSSSEPAITSLLEADQCGGPQACVGLQQGMALELVVTQEGEVDQQYLASESHLVTLSSKPGACFVARTRDLAGRRSSPSEICVQDLSSFEGTPMQALESGCIS